MLNVFLALYFVGILVSISIMDAASILLGGWLICNYFKNKALYQQLKGVPTSISVLFGVWLVVLCLGYITNGVAFKEAIPDLLKFKWMLLVYLGYYTFSCWRFNVKAYNFIFSVVAISSLYAVAITVFGYDLVRPQKALENPIPFLGGLRTSGFLGNPMTFAQSTGILFAFLCALIFAFFYTYKKTQDETRLPNAKSKILFGVAIVTWVAILFSFTRSVWLSVTLGISFMGFITRPRYGFVAGLLLVASIGAITFGSSAIHNRVVNMSSPSDASNQDRLVLWSTNWQIFKEAPIFGIGFGQNVKRLSYYYEKFGVPENSFKSDAHNQYLDYLSCTGALGLLCYLLFLALLFWQALKTFQQAKAQENFLRMVPALTVMGAIIHLLASGVFEANFEDAETLHCFFIYVGAMLATPKS